MKVPESQLYKMLTKARYHKVLNALSKGQCSIFELLDRRQIQRTEPNILRTQHNLSFLIENGVVQQHGLYYMLTADPLVGLIQTHAEQFSIE